MRISVIIPTCNRPGQLRECLRRVASQQGRYEVIVSDDGAGDGVLRVVQEFQGVRRLKGPRRGPAANRNFAAGHATGEWLVFLDDDCLPEDGWLAAYESPVSDEAEVMEGKTTCPVDDGFSFYDIVENLDGGAFLSCNLAIRRRKFLELGGFDEDFTEPCAEDMEFAWRIRKAGLRGLFASQAVVSHPPRMMGLRDLVKRTASHRWVILYRLKTGLGPPLRCSMARAAASLAGRECLDALRMTYHLYSKKNRLRGRILWVLWKCATLCFFLPYYISWELRWRQMLSQRSNAPAPLNPDIAVPSR